ncbi:phosphogluconate dehydratase [Raoultella terrigena]|uniref:Phosphogluconate dehydratase n=1 Tax=Raoultella terrigena TaxID=577 RepID=A0A3P8JHW7_RAOTE|nr:phosphogluconate dehydratase [Raoultella terrigena]
MALLESEAASYHAPGTCTFYGTANTNQMVVEFMGMQLPGSSFVHPDAKLREALTVAAARQVTRLTGNGNEWMPLGKMFDEKWWSTASWRCWRPAAQPTIRCTWWPWRAPRASSSTGMTSPNCRTWCRCWRASIRTVRRISTTSRQQAGVPC